MSDSPSDVKPDAKRLKRHNDEEEHQRRSRSSSRERFRDHEERSKPAWVYFTNIPFSMRWSELKDLAKTQSDVTPKFVDVLKSRDDKPRGAAVAEFFTLDDAEIVQQKLHKTSVMERDIIVDVIRNPVAFFRKVENDTGVDYLKGDSSDRRAKMQRSSDSTFGRMGIRDQDVCTRVFVANLPFNLQVPQLRGVFSLAGKVNGIELNLDENGKFKGIAIIEYQYIFEAVQSIRMLNGQKFNDRTITVKMDRFDPSPIQRGPNGLPDGLRRVGPGLGDNGEVLYTLGEVLNSRSREFALNDPAYRQMAEMPPASYDSRPVEYGRGGSSNYDRAPQGPITNDLRSGSAGYVRDRPMTPPPQGFSQQPNSRGGTVYDYSNRSSGMGYSLGNGAPRIEQSTGPPAVYNDYIPRSGAPPVGSDFRPPQQISAPAHSMDPRYDAMRGVPVRVASSDYRYEPQQASRPGIPASQADRFYDRPPPSDDRIDGHMSRGMGNGNMPPMADYYSASSGQQPPRDYMPPPAPSNNNPNYAPREAAYTGRWADSDSMMNRGMAPAGQSMSGGGGGPRVKVIVRNLPYNLTDDHLRSLGREAGGGDWNQCQIINAGVGLIWFESYSDADRARRFLNGYIYDGKPLQCDLDTQ